MIALHRPQKRAFSAAKVMHDSKHQKDIKKPGGPLMISLEPFLAFFTLVIYICSSCLVGWSFVCLVGWLVVCLFVWLVGRLFVCLFGWLVGCVGWLCRLLGWLVVCLFGCVGWLCRLVGWPVRQFVSQPVCLLVCLFGPLCCFVCLLFC